jgi:DNA-binding winged helix-turn-helix (wHTH) protein
VAASFAFEDFVLDTEERRLKLDNEIVELSGRYLDALALLVREHGKLISKDRFLNEVWSGIPVTDEALTQCIRMLRRQLGDDAANPRFIETVPKHGYRFIAPVELAPMAAGEAKVGTPRFWRFVEIGLAGTSGGAAAGLIGGLTYGLMGAARASASGIGGISILLVLASVTLLVAIVGAAGVSFSIATVELARGPSWRWTLLAGAGGGLLIGALAKLLGIDAFTLLVGHAPADITGAPEGIWLGGATGLAAGLSLRSSSLRRAGAVGGAFGAAAGLAISFLGGRLMLGSLELVGRDMPGSRLRLDQLGQLFGETGFGPITAAFSDACEGALFCAFIVGAMTIARVRDRRV